MPLILPIFILLFLIVLMAYWVWRRRYGHPPEDFPVIVAYHKVDNRFEFGITRTTVRQFRRQMEYLSQSNCSVIHPDQVLQTEGVADPVLLTFDDGYAAFYANAFPVLREYGFPALVFLITDYIGQWNAWDANLGWIRFRHLDWDQIREMNRYGIEFGSHTCSHRDLTRLSKAEIRHELADSKAVIEEHLGRPVKYLSYPFGSYDERVIAIAKELDYKAAYSLYPKHSNKVIEPFALQRTCSYLHDTQLSYAIKLGQRSPRLYWTQDLLGRIINWFSYGTVFYTDLKDRMRQKKRT